MLHVREAEKRETKRQRRGDERCEVSLFLSCLFLLENGC